MPESLPGAVITFPLLGENFSLCPTGTYTLFGHTFYWYGAIIGLGFLLAVIFCMARGKKHYGTTTDDLTDVVLVGLPAALVGARLYYVACNWSQYVGDTVWATLWNICKIWEGGSAIPGGILLMLLCVWLLCRKKKISFGAVMDAAALGLLIGQIIGRWSNFVNREAFGWQTDIFCRMGLTLNGRTWYVHPLFLYESLWNLIGFLWLFIWDQKGKRKYDGQLFLLYLAWYGFGRFWLEFLRNAPLYIPGTKIMASQAIMGCCFVVSVILLIVLGRRDNTPDKLWVNRRAAAEAAAAAAAAPAPETAAIPAEENQDRAETPEAAGTGETAGTQEKE